MKKKTAIYLFILISIFILPNLVWAKVDLSNLNNPFGTERVFSGSVTILANQFFLEDEHLRNVGKGGDTAWGALHMDAYFGVHEFKFGLEPLIGVGFMKGSTLLNEGQQVRTNYFMLNGAIGARYKPYGYETFLIQPYLQTLFRYSYLHIQRTLDGTRERAQFGGDFGMEVGGGLIFSFFYDRERKNVLQAEWELKDFGLMTSTRFIKGGWLTKAPFGIKTGGWDFGLGLFLDW